MAEDKCTEERKNALIKPPSLLGDAQLKISLNPMDSIKQSPVISLFNRGIRLSDVVLGCKSGMKLAEVGTKSQLDNWKIKFDCTGGAYFVKLCRGF